MRHFEYFLFENFDADKEADNPNNPRTFWSNDTDAILSAIAQRSAGAYTIEESHQQFERRLIDKLIEAGVLRITGRNLYFDCPIFLREDAHILQTEVALKAATLVDLLENSMTEIQSCCAKIQNGFSIEYNLYHILCGMVFDGHFFDYLSQKCAVATSRRHTSGLDYLTVIYEKCEELQAFSEGLLCSYNRFANNCCSLQSFGDAKGNRLDFYRFFRLMEQGEVLDQFKEVETLLLNGFKKADKDALLSEVSALVQTGHCASATTDLLEKFGYIKNGSICVPVYTRNHYKYIGEIEKIVEKCLGTAMADTLNNLADSMDITAVTHGVNKFEIANELYHIVFGSINEILVSRKMVAAPCDVPGEGRYLRCIEIYF